MYSVLRTLCSVYGQGPVPCQRALPILVHALKAAPTRLQRGRRRKALRPPERRRASPESKGSVPRPASRQDSGAGCNRVTRAARPRPTCCVPAASTPFPSPFVLSRFSSGSTSSSYTIALSRWSRRFPLPVLSYGLERSLDNPSVDRSGVTAWAGESHRAHRCRCPALPRSSFQDAATRAHALESQQTYPR